MRSGKMASLSPRGCPPALPHFYPLLFVACYQLIAAALYCRPHGTLFLSAGQPSYPYRTLSALLSAHPWVSDHGVRWYPHYWDHEIEHGTYGTHGISAYGTYVVVCGVPYAPRGSRTTRLPSLRLFRSLPPFL